jgi:type 1 glutamine amidotransferase
MRTHFKKKTILNSLVFLASLVAALGLRAAPLGLGAENASGLDQAFPIRGFAIAAPSTNQLEAFLAFIREELAPRRVNTLILRVDYNYQYTSHPELKDPRGLAREDVKKLVAACRAGGIRIIPQINLLGHQSWAASLGNLLRQYPEFDETPWVKMPAKYSWPNPDKLYCKSYCPLHPKVHEVVFALVDEICEAFETDAFHAGMDEVFYLGEDRCPRCSGRSPSELFAGEIQLIRNHLNQRGRKLWIWGDRLLDGRSTGLGEWEASLNHTEAAIDLIPKDVVICDWHYERPDQSAVYFAMKGLQVVTCPWKNPASAVLQAQDMVKFRQRATPALKSRFAGMVQTVWTSAGGFLEELAAAKKGGGGTRGTTSAQCFLSLYDEILKHEPRPAAQAKLRNLLVIGQAKGYQHDSVSSAMAALYQTGRSSRHWDTVFRTDCTAITKKPLKWGAKNLDAFDAVLFFTDGDLDLDESQKADLLAFVKEEGKGFIGVHSAAITLLSWPAYGEMLGGRFDGHPWGEFDAPLVVEDPAFPGLGHLPKTFTLKDEIYQIKDFSRDQVRVLLRLDAGKVDLARKEVRRTDQDFAVIWARNYGKGRVLYNGLGHGPEVWDHPGLQKMWLEMVPWAMGLTPGDASPRPKPQPDAR